MQAHLSFLAGLIKIRTGGNLVAQKGKDKKILVRWGGKVRNTQGLNAYIH